MSFWQTSTRMLPGCATSTRGTPPRTSCWTLTASSATESACATTAAFLVTIYDRIVRFGSYNRDTTSLGQFDTDWRTELSEMQGLDRYVCGECRDEAGGSRLRDFIHALNISEWDTEHRLATEQVTIGSSIQYRGRLPKIDRRNPRRFAASPDSERPHLDNQCSYR